MNDGDTIKVETLVQEFLSAQSLKVLPQAPFSDAVNQFVSKDDKHAMELFVSEHLSGQVKQMLGLESDDEDLNSAMDIYKTRMEQQLATGLARATATRNRVLRPKPATWDDDFDGNWEEAPDAWTFENEGPGVTQSSTRGSVSVRGKTQQRDDSMMDSDDAEPAPVKKQPAKRATTTRTTKAAASQKAPAAAKKPAAKKAPARGRGRKVFEDSEEEEMDVVMDSEPEPEPPKPAARATRRGGGASQAATTRAKPAARGKSAATAAKSKSTKQTTINFSQKGGGSGATQDKALEISDDEISDEEDDAFEPAPVASRTRRR